MYIHYFKVHFLIMEMDFFSDGSSLRLGPGSARARHLEGLLELEFWRLDPSIGWVKPQAQASGLRLGIWRLDPSLENLKKAI